MGTWLYSELGKVKVVRKRSGPLPPHLSYTVISASWVSNSRNGLGYSTNYILFLYLYRSRQVFRIASYAEGLGQLIFFPCASKLAFMWGAHTSYGSPSRPEFEPNSMRLQIQCLGIKLSLYGSLLLFKGKPNKAVCVGLQHQFSLSLSLTEIIKTTCIVTWKS